MTEQDVYWRFEELYASFDQEGNTPRTQELTRKTIQDAFDAGFSGEEIDAIHAQVITKIEAC